ncbi:MAG: aspartate kinase [Verrucomicrobia bacterium]|nr:MAG: aspartate kinase [Verrucomicrobiota bacterium]
MPLIVQKYGGTSVGTAERIKNAARRILETHRNGNSVVAVVSAMSGVTDSLIRMARGITGKPTDREMDALLATGEQTTTALTAIAINSMGGNAVSLTGWQAGIRTNDIHTKAKIHDIVPTAIREHLEKGTIVIVAGFQGHTSSGHITTLGRGGSDLTAIALAAALKADNCEIYTDVDGIFTCDPRIVPAAKKIDVISYDELLEMASSGSKVMQSRSVEFAKKFAIPFEVRNSFNNNRGTLVKEEPVEKVAVRGVSLEKNQAKVTISQVPDRPGSASRLFGVLADTNVVVDVIIQNVNVAESGATDISFTINKDDLEKVGPGLESAAADIGAGKITKRDGIAKLSVVGIGMRTHSGVAAKLFEVLSKGGINIQMISTSEIKIAVIINESCAEEAARLVHKAFLEED